jgi:hypothetical protein
MRKSVFILVALLAAGISQAASVQWNSGAIKTPNPDGTFGANVGAGSSYTALVLFYTDAAGTLLVPGVAGNTDTTTSSLSVLNGTTSGANFVAGTTYYARLFVTSNDGKWEQTSVLAQFVEPGTGNANLNFLTGGGFATVNNKMPTVWTPVPEPTTMALLGIGAAVVGLRRKFRKS